MNRSMKQMLSALLVVAMLATMLVVPGIAAGEAGSATYKVTADAATVKVDETTTVNAKLVYGVNDDTYALDADTVYTVTGDAKVAVTAYTVSGDAVAITVKGVEAGEGNVTVTINGYTGVVKVTVEPEATPVPSAEPTVAPSEEPGPDPIVPTGELADGEYRMSVKGEGKESTVTCADGVIPGLAWNAGASMHADHGMQGVTGFAVTVPAGKTATVTVYTCCYGTGAPFSLVSGTATVGESEAIAGSEQDKDTKTVITGVSGTAQFALTGSAYVHCVTVELAGGAPEGAAIFEADSVYAALDPDGSIAGADSNGDYKGAKEAYTLDGFTVYPKFAGYAADGSSKGYNALEIRNVTRWKNADKATPVWSDNYAPTKAFRMDGGGNKTAEWADKSAGTTTEFLSNVIKFTVDAPSEVTVWFIQKDAAAVALYEEMNPVAVAQSDAITVAESEAGIATVVADKAGTYFLGGCDANGEGAKINVAKLMVVAKEETVEPSTAPSAQPSTEPSTAPSAAPEMTVYTVSTDVASVSVRVNGTKTVNVTTTPAGGEVYVVSADANVTATVAGNVLSVKGVKAGKAVVVLGVKDGEGTATVNVTVTESSLAAPSGSASGTTPNDKVQTDANGNTSKKTTDRNGNVTITVTDKNGEVVAKVVLPASIPALAKKFQDVPDEHWAAKSINDLASLGLVKGVADEIYDMNTPVTRGSLATILFRLAQATGATSDFTDVAADAWYADAVGWAAKVGIIAGKGDGTFSADESITREQLAVMLYRFANLLGLDTKLAGKLSDFADGEATSDWATEAMVWAVGAGILKGTDTNELLPTAAASRAETACMVDRFLSLVK